MGDELAEAVLGVPSEPAFGTTRLCCFVAYGFRADIRTTGRNRTRIIIFTVHELAGSETGAPAEAVLGVPTQTTRASPVPLTTSPMIQALCLVALMARKISSARSAATMAVMPMPMLKT